MSQTQIKDEFQHYDERISSIYDGEYFRVIHRKDDNLIVQCITCGPDAPHLRASRRSNGNILKHIQRRHSELLAKIRTEKNIKCRATGTRRSSIKIEILNKGLERKLLNPSTSIGDENKTGVVYIDTASASDSMTNFHYLGRNDCSDGENIQLLETDDNLITEEQETTDFMNHENLLSHDVTDKPNGEKSSDIDCGCDDDVSSEVFKAKNKDMIELRKELMLREFEEVQEMRREKHRFEIEILRRELEFKKIEHRKKIELLNKQLREK